MVNIDGEEVLVHLAMVMGLYPSKLSDFYRVGESFEEIQIRYNMRGVFLSSKRGGRGKTKQEQLQAGLVLLFV